MFIVLSAIFLLSTKLYTQSVSVVAISTLNLLNSIYFRDGRIK